MKMGIKCNLCIPIRFEGNPVGTLNISSFSKNAFEEEDIKLLSLIVQQIEVAIHNAKQAAIIRESEERCRTIIENNYGVICETNLDGRLLYIGSKFDLLGYKPADFWGEVYLITVGLPVSFFLFYFIT